jgi:hypothetical protein
MNSLAKALKPYADSEVHHEGLLKVAGALMTKYEADGRLHFMTGSLDGLPFIFAVGSEEALMPIAAQLTAAAGKL